MNNAVRRYVEAATSLGNLTRVSAEKVAKQLVEKGETAADGAGELVDELLERQRRNRDAVSAIVRAETNRVVKAMGLASVTEVERLQKQVADLKRSLGEAEKIARSTARKLDKVAGPAKKSTAARKTATRKAATGKAATGKAGPSTGSGDA